MTSKPMLRVGLLIVLTVGAFLFGSLVSDRQSGANATPSASGPWAVAGGDSGGYLVNTQTGEVWRLSADIKVPVHAPGK